VISGGFGSIVGNPADLIKVRMQADAKLPKGIHFKSNIRHTKKLQKCV
jgi:hypothetical protein